MPVDPQFAPLLAMTESAPPFSEVPLEALRGGMGGPRPADFEPTPVAQVIDEFIPGPRGDIKIRIYRPHAAGVRPILLFMHGGGFILGDLDTHDEAARPGNEFVDHLGDRRRLEVCRPGAAHAAAQSL